MITCCSLFGCAQEKKSTAISAETRPIAFPGAEGFGKYTTGGRGGRVIKVTNLNDDGPGSLRIAIENSGPRVIIFTVSGTIALESPLKINHGDLTIAGQTAPGDGITIKNYTTTVSAENVIIRFLRFRLGNEKNQQDDAFKGNRQKNVIIDHCSMSWSVDECASFYYNSDFTMQWCLVAQSLNHSVHEKGNHGYGGIWGGMGASFHHNLLADHTSRNPRFSGSSTTPNPEDELVDFRNNVVFNWVHNSAYGGEKGRYNMVNNYYKPGTATSDKTSARIVNPSEPYGRFFVDGNFVEGSEKVSQDNWAGGVQCEHPDSARHATPFPVTAIAQQSAKDAYESVLRSAGASLKRDAIDLMVIAEVRSGQSTAGPLKNGIINTQEDVGGWPVLQSLPAPADTDNDGMPDMWENIHRLNPNDPSDGKAFGRNKQYTNLELYLNELVSKVIS